MSQHPLNHGRKFFRSGWWFILLPVFLFVAVVAWSSSYYSVIAKYEFNNWIGDPSKIVSFEIQNSTDEKREVGIEKKYIYELELFDAYKGPNALFDTSSQKLLKAGKFYVELPQALKEKLNLRLYIQKFYVASEYEAIAFHENFGMIEIQRQGMTYIDSIRVSAGNEPISRQIQDNKSHNIELIKIDEISQQSGCDCNLKSIPQVVEMIKIRKCQCMLSDIFYKRQNNINYLMYCGLDPSFYLMRLDTKPVREVGCRVEAYNNHYRADFSIKRSFLEDFDDLAGFLLNRFKLI